MDSLRYRLEIAMTELAEGLGGGVREREEAKATPGVFTYSVAGGEGVVRTSLRGDSVQSLGGPLLGNTTCSCQGRSQNLSLW